MVKNAQHQQPQPVENGTQRLTVSLPTNLYMEIQLIAKRDSRSLGWIIRKAVENLVREEQPLFFTPKK